MKSKTYEPPISSESIDNIEPIVICMDDETPPGYGKHPIMKSINLLLSHYEEPIEKMHLIIGEDRASSYGWLQESMGKRDPPIQLDIEAISRPAGAISATIVRGLATDGVWEDFFGIMQTTGLPESEIRRLFTELNTRLNITEKENKKKRKGKEKWWK